MARPRPEFAPVVSTARSMPGSYPGRPGPPSGVRGRRPRDRRRATTSGAVAGRRGRAAEPGPEDGGQRDGDGPHQHADEHVVRRSEQLQRRQAEHDDERRADHEVGRLGRHPGADVHGRDGAEQQAGREAELEVAEEDVTERGGADERDRLHEVGAHQPGGGQHRVEHQQGDDDQRAGADRRHADDEPAHDADQHGRDRLDLHGACRDRPPPRLGDGSSAS